VPTRAPSVPGSSVSQDWRAPLSIEKSETFAQMMLRLETAYSIFSVNLDEALGMRRRGRARKASQVLSVSSALCKRLTTPLIGLLRSMQQHTRHFGTTPNLVPLDPGNFQIPKSQRSAFFNGLFSKVLLARKAQFVHKISALAGMVEELAEAFDSAVDELTDTDAQRPERNWELLDAAHYDLNTCLRESVVLMKCFLQALPDRELVEFQSALQTHSSQSLAPVTTRTRHLTHRRMTLIKGQ